MVHINFTNLLHSVGSVGEVGAWFYDWHGSYGSRESTKFWCGSKKMAGSKFWCGLKNVCMNFYYDYIKFYLIPEYDSSLFIFQNQKITSLCKNLIKLCLK